MKLTSQARLSRVVLYLLLLLFVVSLLFLPFGLKFLTLPEQVFVVTLLVFLIIYSKLFGWYYFVSVLLSLIDKWEDVYNHLASKLSKDSLYKYLLEGDILVLTETQLLKVKEIWSLVFDITLVFLLWLWVVFIWWVLDISILYAVLFAVMIVWLLALFMELYVSLKFERVFEKEIEELAEVMFRMNLENQIDEKKVDMDLDSNNSDSNNKTISTDEKTDNLKDVNN